MLDHFKKPLIRSIMLSLPLVGGLWWGACSSIDCNLEGKVLCHYALTDEEGNEVKLEYPLSVTLIRDNVGEEDTLFINMLGNATTFDVPMSYASDIDRVVLTLNIPYTEVVDTVETTAYEYIHDTISIAKTNEPLFESVDCSPRYNHTVTDVKFTSHFISDVIVNRNKIDNNALVPNILIRLRANVE